MKTEARHDYSEIRKGTQCILENGYMRFIISLLLCNVSLAIRVDRNRLHGEQGLFSWGGYVCHFYTSLDYKY